VIQTHSLVNPKPHAGGPNSIANPSTCRMMLVSSNQNLRRARTSNHKKDAIIAELKAENANLVKKHVLKKRNGRFFSPEGGLQIALRQCGSLAAAHTIGIAAGMDVHGTPPTLKQK
jgi:hypothetical protein